MTKYKCLMKKKIPTPLLFTLIINFKKIFPLLVVFAPTFLEAATSLPVPRFATLRSNNIIMRVGPGREYPIKWKLHRKGLPIKILAEYDTWRQVICHDGSKGWIHQSLLSGKRNLLVVGDGKFLLSSSNRSAMVKAKLSDQLLLATKVKKCTSDRCPVTIQDQWGWVNKKDVWGLLKSE